MIQGQTIQPTNAEIARYAYLIWEHEGKPRGRDITHWLEAEKHLKANLAREAALQQPKASVQRRKTLVQPKQAKHPKLVTA